MTTPDESCRRTEAPHSLSPVPRGEGRGEGLGSRPIVVQASGLKTGWRVNAHALALLFVVTLPAGATTARENAVAPATLPTTSPADRETRDALSEIDSLAAPTPGSPGGTSSSSTVSGPSPAPSRWKRRLDNVEFFAPGLVMAAAIGMSGAILGLFVLLRREALLALALPQVVAAGAAFGMRMEWPTLPPALVVAAAALVYLILARRRGGAAATLPALYISGLSVSFLIIAGAAQHVEDLQHLFTGVDVAVTPARAAVAAPVLLCMAGLCAVLWRRWLLVAQSPAAAELAGRHPARWDALFLSLLTVVLLLGTDSQGVVMVLAMLFLPAAAVMPWTRRIPVALVAASALSLVLVAVAFVLSNALDWPLSQSVGGVGFAVFLVSHVVAYIVT